MKKKELFRCIALYFLIYVLIYFFDLFSVRSIIYSIVKDSIYYYLSVIIIVLNIIFYDKKIYKKLKINSKNLKYEIFIGILIFICLSLLTIIPFLLTKNNKILSVKPLSRNMLIYFTIFNLFVVAPCEEFIYRGYFFEKFKLIFNNNLTSNIISSILFGVIHYPNKESLVLIIAPTIIGIIFTILKEKIINCSLISLSIAHGLNNVLIDWIAYFFT